MNSNPQYPTRAAAEIRFRLAGPLGSVKILYYLNILKWAGGEVGLGTVQQDGS